MTKTILTPFQADRDAAAPAFREPQAQWVRDGEMDDDPLVQRLARHALTARKEGEALGMEKAAAELVEWFMRNHAHDSGAAWFDDRIGLMLDEAGEPLDARHVAIEAAQAIKHRLAIREASHHE